MTLSACFNSWNGDLILLGINGKVGLSLGRMAKRAAEAAGIPRRIIGVSRFTDPAGRNQLHNWGIETVACDLTDAASILHASARVRKRYSRG